MKISKILFVLISILATTTSCLKEYDPGPKKHFLIQPSNKDCVDGYIMSCDEFKYSFIRNCLIAGTWSFSNANCQNSSFRSYMEYDISEIPKDAIIKSAKYSLFSEVGQVFSSKQGHYHEPNQLNSIIIKRVISRNPTDVSWVNMPTATSQNSYFIAKSQHFSQDFIDIDITMLVQDAINSNNDKLMMLIKGLQEEPYRKMAFCSSSHADKNKRPKLEIEIE